MTIAPVAAAVGSALGLAADGPVGPIDWAAFVEVARRHGVGPLLDPAWLDAAAAPDAARTAFALERRQNAGRALAQQALILELTGALAAIDVPVVVLRGLPLAAGYGDIVRRPVGEVDLLLRVRRAGAAGGVCEDLGFSPVGGRALATTAAGSTWPVRRVPVSHRVSLVRGAELVRVHWRLFANPRLQPMARHWPTEIRSVPLGRGSTAPALPALVSWWHVCVHGTNDGWRTLRSVADVAALVLGHAELVSPEALAETSDAGLDRCVAAALLTADVAFGPFLDESVRSWTATTPGVDRLVARGRRRMQAFDAGEPHRPVPTRAGAARIRPALRADGAYRRQELIVRAAIRLGARTMPVSSPEPLKFRTRRAAGRWRSRLGRAAALPSRRRRLVAEAALELARASVVVRLTPDRRLIARLGTPDRASGSTATDGKPADGLGHEVGKTVERMAGRLPWHPSCLRQAIATQRMLRRRAISHEVHLGVRSARLDEAHAWVRVGDEVIVGNLAGRPFTSVGVFL